MIIIHAGRINILTYIQECHVNDYIIFLVVCHKGCRILYMSSASSYACRLLAMYIVIKDIYRPLLMKHLNNLFVGPFLV